MIKKWYIIHTASGAERSVRKMIEDKIEKDNMSSYFEEIVVPIIEVPEIKRGQRIMVKKKIMPGYILIKMKIDEKSLHLVTSTYKVTGFLGGSKTHPKPLIDKEVKNIFDQMEVASENAKSVSSYNIGDKVQVIDGPFDSLTAVIQDIDSDSQKLKVSVSIFGKSTLIELDFSQVEKII